MNDIPQPEEPDDQSTDLAEKRTELAMKRTAIAAERTLMAWVRTSISMIGFGFTIFKFFVYLAESEGVRPGRLVGPQQLALFLVTIGTIMLFAAVLQHWQFIGSLEYPAHSKWSLSVIVALLIVLIGLWAFFNILYT